MAVPFHWLSPCLNSRMAATRILWFFRCSLVLLVRLIVPVIGVLIFVQPFIVIVVVRFRVVNQTEYKIPAHHFAPFSHQEIQGTIPQGSQSFMVRSPWVRFLGR